MSEMNQLINEQLQWFVFGFVVIMLVLIVTVIAQGAKLRTIRRKYEV